ncbi:MAG: ACP S-malonyltransferase [Pseudomonadota bacterium]|nr:ACP S-malonyltransferase [Pseudomonadota bacterium]
MSKFAFVFPGQGSQAIGMLNGLADNAVVRATLAEASDVLQFDMAALIAHGPKEALDLTTNTQPVMLTASVAIYRAWRAAGGTAPDFVAGHSLGEYAALVAAEAISFRDALPLVRFRAEAMQQAVLVGQGAMAAILGLADAEVQAVCNEASQGEVVEAVNFNAPAQVVIAGSKAAVDRACVIAKEKGAKRALLLPVSAPFHSSLLQPASDRLRGYLDTVTVRAPQIVLINNVDVASPIDPLAIKDALVRQAASPVRWVETVQELAARGATCVVECGPGKVLAGLTRRIAPDVTSEAMFDQASVDASLALVAGVRA